MVFSSFNRGVPLSLLSPCFTEELGRGLGAGGVNRTAARTQRRAGRGPAREPSRGRGTRRGYKVQENTCTMQRKKLGPGDAAWTVGATYRTGAPRYAGCHILDEPG